MVTYYRFYITWSIIGNKNCSAWRIFSVKKYQWRSVSGFYFKHITLSDLRKWLNRGLKILHDTSRYFFSIDIQYWSKKWTNTFIWLTIGHINGNWDLTWSLIGKLKKNFHKDNEKTMSILPLPLMIKFTENFKLEMSLYITWYPTLSITSWDLIKQNKETNKQANKQTNKP